MRSGSLICGGRRLTVPPEGLTIGRSDSNDVVLDGERVSRQHARLHAQDGDYVIADLGSRHGTFLNGAMLRGEARALADGDTITIGDEHLRFLSGQETRLASRELPVVETQTVRLERPRLTIGRDSRNDLVLADPNVSRFHAELVQRDGEAELIDLGSRNGTRLNGEPVDRAVLTPGSEVGIGPYSLLFDGAAFVARDEQGALRLDALGLEMTVGEKRILAPTSVTVEPGELVAIIGESGAGKSTLLRALAGVTRPSAGRITLNGEPLAARLTDIGYLPQDEIVHEHLSVREALGYAARLRLPADAGDEEIAAAVDRVVVELALEEQAGTRIGALSGGQRKRTGVAVELLGRPSLLFLDEPTTGMDPGLESKMMALFRSLADSSRAVVLVTHATKNLALCDRVVVMGRGGQLTFEGSPAAALEFFEVEDFDGIYDALDATPATDWRQRFEAASPAAEAEAPEPPAEPAPRRRTSVLGQTGVLVRRYVKLLVRDRRNLALLVGQAPVLALAGVGLFKTGLFDRPGGNPGDAIQLLFLAVIVAIWLGSIDAAREIVKELSVVDREAAVGVSLSAYLLSKVIVLFGLVTVQVLLYAAVLLGFRPLHEPVGTYAVVVALLVFTGFVGVTMGLLVSAAVSSEDQSMSFIPLAIIPQLLFAGTIVSVARMAEPAHTLSRLVFGQWSLASIGDAVHMNARMGESPQFARVSHFGTHFFDVRPGLGFLILAGFLLAFAGGTALLLQRRQRRNG